MMQDVVPYYRDSQYVSISSSSSSSSFNHLRAFDSKHVVVISIELNCKVFKLELEFNNYVCVLDVVVRMVA